MVFCGNIMAKDGDPQCKMENASDQEDTGDESTAPIAEATEPKLVFLPSAILAVSTKRLEIVLETPVPNPRHSRSLQH